MQRQEVIDIVGREAVEKVESMNCEPTGGLGYCGSAHGDEYTEWCAWLRVDSNEFDYVAVYYYTTNDEDEKIAEQDGSAINWTPERWLLV